jgi:putative RNA 2'-phosphotransferase
VSEDLTAASKFLARVLRHDPGALGLRLGQGGWIPVDELVEAAARHALPLSGALLRQVLEAPGKARFEARGGLIRAAQGHSVPVDLGLDSVVPPAVLYHGTVARFLPGILREGLRPGRRVHVHLSADEATAIAVGARRGRPVVLRVDAAGMSAAGHDFFRAANGVWLAGRVPRDFLDSPGEPGAGGLARVTGDDHG